jgi:hypothetical protein
MADETDTTETYDVYAPNSGFSGVREGVSFVRGKGQAPDKETALSLKQRGYRVPALDEEAPDSLDDIEGVGPKTLEDFQEAGIEDLQDLAEAEFSHLVEEAGLDAEDATTYQMAAATAVA